MPAMGRGQRLAQTPKLAVGGGLAPVPATDAPTTVRGGYRTLLPD